jgi:hypothetical protein
VPTAGGSLPFFPDFVLVGAPRCGTTAMSRYLGGHPNVCFSRPKEPHYFSYHDPSSPEQVRDEYLDLFFGHYDPSVHRSVGDGSISTLYFPEAQERFLRWNPEVRFLLMVRNPLQMIPSYHGRLLFVLEEDEPDLRRAWELQEERARGERIPRHCRDARLLQYADVGRLGRHDLVSDPLDVYRSVLGFLGLEYDGRTDFRPKTQSRAYRWRWLHRILYKPPAPLVQMAIREHRKKRGRRGGLGRLRKRLRQWNRTDRPIPPLEPAMRRLLQDAFADDVKRLGQLLERDLEHWIREPDSRT